MSRTRKALGIIRIAMLVSLASGCQGATPTPGAETTADRARLEAQPAEIPSVQAKVADPADSVYHGPAWARVGGSCRATSPTRLPPVVPDTSSDVGASAWAEYNAALAAYVPGGFGGLFFEYDPPFPAMTRPNPEARRVTLLLVDTTKAAAAFTELAPEIAERSPYWDGATRRVARARWTVPELRAWYWYLSREPGVRQAAPMMLLDAKQNNLRFGVWNQDQRRELEAQLERLDVPCFLVMIEVAFDPTRERQALQSGLPAEGTGVRYNRSCQVPEGEPAPGWRTYDLHVDKRWDGPSRKEEAVQAVALVGGRLTHRFNVEVIRAELTASQARFLTNLPSDLIRMAVAVRDTQVRNVYVNIRYPNLAGPENIEALKGLTERPVSARRGRYVQTIVADSNIPRIRGLPGVASVEVTGMGCGSTGPARPVRSGPR